MFFGPYCKPHYNSVVSTFSHQLINNDVPSIIVDNNIELIYIQNLVKKIDDILTKKYNYENYTKELKIKYDKKISVSDLLLKLKKLKKIILIIIFYQTFTMSLIKIYL